MKRVISFLCSLALVCSGGLQVFCTDVADVPFDESVSSITEVSEETAPKDSGDAVSQQAFEPDQTPVPEATPVPSPVPVPTLDPAPAQAQIPAAREAASTDGPAVEQVFGERTPSSILITCGTLVSGGETELSFHHGKILALSAASQQEGGCKAEAEFLLAPDMLPGDWTQGILRLCFSNAASGVVQTISVYDWNADTYQQLDEEPLTEDRDIPMETSLAAYLSDQGQVKIRITFVSTENFQISMDQLQLIYAYRSAVDTTQIEHYTVSNAIVEQGSLSPDTSFDALKERDGITADVVSADNKVAWHTIVPLYQERTNIKSLRIDYAGGQSAQTNDLWLSLYRFDTENWEAIGLLPGETGQNRRMFVLSGDKLQSYLSAEGDLRVRLYNSATGSFTRQTDALSITVYSAVTNSQQGCVPVSLLTEYGSSTGNVSDLSKPDGRTVVTQSNADKKAAIQLGFETSAPLDSIRELTFTLRMKADGATNPQYISLLNKNTGRFAVIKTLSASETMETVYVTLDSLREIEQYLDNGQLTLRIYNSSATSFTRELDFAQMTVTYGGFTRFTVAQISDVHELIGTENFKGIINEVNQNVDEAFTIVTGDISDHGTPAQYALYLEDRKLFQNPVYTTPGNHDVRWWNANGKKTFTDSVGPLYQSFEYGGIHFVLLDSTVNYELDGKINKAQLEWLRQDMADVPSGMPVIWFAHHPFKINNNVTARHELLELAKGHNVIAFMAGHVHYYGNVREDGIPVNYVTYVKDNNAQEFVTIEFTPNYYYIYKHKASDGSRTLWLTGRMNNTRQMDLAIDQVQVNGDGTIHVQASTSVAPDGVASMQARIDNYGPYTAMQRNSDGSWSCEIDPTDYTPELVPGSHFVGVEAFDNNGEKWTDYADYTTQSSRASIRWVFETGDMIQSTATILGSQVFVGSNDGSLYCINAQSGAKMWSFATGGPVISKPAALGQTKIVFGSQDGKVYCLDASSGEKQWEYTAGGSVLSDPLAEQDRIYVGSGDGKIFCLDAATGMLQWSYQTQGVMRQRPVVHNGILYAFVRDTYIWYALDAQTGELYWRGNAGTDESLFVCGDVRPILAGGKLWCIDAQNTRPGYLNLQTGALSWTGTLEKVSSRGMATDGDLVFYTSNNGRQLTAYNAQTTQIAWQTDLRYNSRDGDLQEMQIDSALVYEDGVLYHLAERGRVTAIDPASGDVLWKFDAAGYPERVFWSTPEISGNLLLASGIDGKLYAVEIAEK